MKISIKLKAYPYKLSTEDCSRWNPRLTHQIDQSPIYRYPETPKWRKVDEVTERYGNYVLRAV